LPPYLQMIANFIQRYSGVLVPGVMCVIALLSFREYGLAWDENAQRSLGLITWNYIFKGDNTLLTIGDSDHGVSFELFLIFIEDILKLSDTRDIYLMRHLVSHLFFLLGALCCYKLVDLLYQNKLLSLIGLLLFLLHPLMYAHSFFNTKDIPFLTLCMICFYLSARLFQKKRIRDALFLGSAFGLLINLRLMGILIFGSVLLILFLDMLIEKKWIFYIKLFSVLTFTALLILYIGWPYLWNSPVQHFCRSLKSMAHFSWDLINLIGGEQIPANKLRWNYVPVWFSITTPIPYLLAGFTGIVAFIYFFIRQPAALFKTLEGKCNLLFLICFFVPVLAVIVLKSVVYDGWRHLFFIYSPFIMLAVFGLHKLVRYKKPAIAVLFISFLWMAGFMIANAPFQHVYFNAFVSFREPEYIRKNYDMDYWGTSYTTAFEHILQNDTAAIIKVNVGNDAGLYAPALIPKEQRSRLLFTSFEETTYFFSNYRWHPEDFPFEDKKVFSIKVQDNTINSVFKLR
jgi:hypothetical protein